MNARTGTPLLERARSVFASRGWFIYYADWEQRGRLRLGPRLWTAIARVGIHGLPAVERGVAMFHVTRANPTRVEERERARSPEYARLAERLASAGYKPLLADDEESSHYVKQFAPTATALHRERAAIDVLLNGHRGRTLRPKRANAYVAAFREFARSDRWRSAGAGWSLHVEFPPGGSAALSMLLTQGDDGTFLGNRELRAEVSVLIWPPKGRETEIERLAPPSGRPDIAVAGDGRSRRSRESRFRCLETSRSSPSERTASRPSAGTWNGSRRNLFGSARCDRSNVLRERNALRRHG